MPMPLAKHDSLCHVQPDRQVYRHAAGNKELGADCPATGHYVQRFVGANGAELHRAADPAKDQSYFPFATTKEQLEFARSAGG